MLEQGFKRWDITCPQYRLLDFLASSDQKIRPKDLAEALEIDVAASTRLIDRLEKKQMVDRVRCTDDRRVCFVSITKTFKNEFSKIQKHHGRIEEVFLEGLDQKQRAIFRMAITELAKLKKYRSGETGLSVVF